MLHRVLHNRLQRFQTMFAIALVSLSLVIGLCSPGSLVTAPAMAQGAYPTAIDPYVNDYAQVMTAQDVNQVRLTFSDLELEHGIEAVVVTIPSIQDYGTGDATIEAFATRLFNTWGIGDRQKNNGVLLLVAVRDRKVRIEVGSGYGSSLDAPMKTIIDQTIIPRFKVEDYSGGIRQGAGAIAQRIISPTPQPSIPTGSGSTGLWLIGGAVAALGATVYGIQRYLRHRPRHCPQCRTQMVCLDEADDDQFLRQAQQLEEQLESVDYDVWRCPTCSYQKIHRYASAFSRYSKCKSCGSRTLEKKRRTVTPASYTHSGTARVTENCQQCGHHNTYTVTIPRKTRSSSSSSSGGGGRSSGGGASGSW